MSFHAASGPGPWSVEKVEFSFKDLENAAIIAIPAVYYDEESAGLPKLDKVKKVLELIEKKIGASVASWAAGMVPFLLETINEIGEDINGWEDWALEDIPSTVPSFGFQYTPGQGYGVTGPKGGSGVVPMPYTGGTVTNEPAVVRISDSSAPVNIPRPMHLTQLTYTSNDVRGSVDMDGAVINPGDTLSTVFNVAATAGDVQFEMSGYYE